MIDSNQLENKKNQNTSNNINNHNISKVIHSFKKDFNFSETNQICSLNFSDYFFHSTKYLESTPTIFSINSDYVDPFHCIIEFKQYIHLVNQNNQFNFLKKYHYHLFFRLHFFFRNSEQYSNGQYIQKLLDECLPLIPEAKSILENEELYNKESICIIHNQIRVPCTVEIYKEINQIINKPIFSSFRPLFISTISLEIILSIPISNSSSKSKSISLSEKHSEKSNFSIKKSDISELSLKKSSQNTFNNILEIYIKDSLFSIYTSCFGTPLLFTSFSNKNINNNITKNYNNNIFVSEFDYFDRYSPDNNSINTINNSNNDFQTYRNIEIDNENNNEKEINDLTFQFPTSSQLLSQALHKSKFIYQHSYPLTSLSTSQNSQILLGTDINGTISISSNFLDYPKTETILLDETIWTSKFAPKGGSYLIGLDDNKAQLRYFSKIIRLFEGHLGPVVNVDYHPNCAFISTSSLDHTVRIWDIRLPETVRLFICHDSIQSSMVHNYNHSGNCTFSHNGELIAYTDLSKIKIGHISQQKIQQEIIVPSSNERTLISNIFFSNDDRYLYFLQNNSHVFCYDLHKSSLTQIFKSEYNITSIELKNNMVYVYSA